MRAGVEFGAMKELAREREGKGETSDDVLRPNAPVAPFDRELELEDRQVKEGSRRRYI
jgi:hypothetical protein